MTFVALLLVSPYIRPCLGFEAFLDGGLGLAQNRVDKTGSYDLERPFFSLPPLLYETMSSIPCSVAMHASVGPLYYHHETDETNSIQQCLHGRA